MLGTALLWGAIQGLTEFLPISSSGHLVLVPALLGIETPDLAMTALLHVGTLLAVLVYYRTDLLRVLRFRTDPFGRKVLLLLAIGTVPAAVAGLLLEDTLDGLSPPTVAVALMITGLVLFVSGFFVGRERRLDEARASDAVWIGLAQAFALVPGISRSGTTITMGLARRFDAVEAARFSFLLAIPAITGAGGLQLLRLADSGGIEAWMWGGVAAAAASGYAAIAILLRAMARFGLRAFAAYCILGGLAAAIAL